MLQSHNKSNFNIAHFDKNPFICKTEQKREREREKEKAVVFQISHFYWLFSSDVTAVKGLIGRKAGDHRGEYYKRVQALAASK